MTEHENRNSLRNYPFSSEAPLTDILGVSFPTDVFVDAIFYPASADATVIGLTMFDSTSGKVVVSNGASEYSGMVSIEGECIELSDGDGAHAGTLVCGPGIGRELASGRIWRFRNSESAKFAASCVVPVVLNCVTEVYVEGKDSRIRGRELAFLGEGRLEVKADPEDNSLQFNVLPDSSEKEKVADLKLKTLVVAVRGKTQFRITSTGDDSVLVTMDYLTTEDVCYQAHREDAVVKVVDVCIPAEEDNELSCGPTGPDGKPPSFPDKYQRVNLKGCGVSLQAYDLVNYRNPVKISTVAGELGMNPPIMSDVSTQRQAEEEVRKLVLAMASSGNGIKIEIPGAGA